MSGDMKVLVILASGFLLAVGLAWLFSGSVLAPVTAVPVALITGWLGARAS
jgi:hypothetical protein